MGHSPLSWLVAWAWNEQHGESTKIVTLINNPAIWKLWRKNRGLFKVKMASMQVEEVRPYIEVLFRSDIDIERFKRFLAKSSNTSERPRCRTLTKCIKKAISDDANENTEHGQSTDVEQSVVQRSVTANVLQNINVSDALDTRPSSDSLESSDIHEKDCYLKNTSSLQDMDTEEFVFKEKAHITSSGASSEPQIISTAQLEKSPALHRWMPLRFPESETKKGLEHCNEGMLKEVVDEGAIERLLVFANLPFVQNLLPVIETRLVPNATIIVLSQDLRVFAYIQEYFASKPTLTISAVDGDHLERQNTDHGVLEHINDNDCSGRNDTSKNPKVHRLTSKPVHIFLGITDHIMVEEPFMVQDSVHHLRFGTIDLALAPPAGRVSSKETLALLYGSQSLSSLQKRPNTASAADFIKQLTDCGALGFQVDNYENIISRRLVQMAFQMLISVPCATDEIDSSELLARDDRKHNIEKMAAEVADICRCFSHRNVFTAEKLLSLVEDYCSKPVSFKARESSMHLRYKQGEMNQNKMLLHGESHSKDAVRASCGNLGARTQGQKPETHISYRVRVEHDFPLKLASKVGFLLSEAKRRGLPCSLIKYYMSRLSVRGELLRKARKRRGVQFVDRDDPSKELLIGAESLEKVNVRIAPELENHYKSLNIDQLISKWRNFQLENNGTSLRTARHRMQSLSR